MNIGKEKGETAVTSEHSERHHTFARDTSSSEFFEKDLAAAIVSENAQHIDTITENRVRRKIDLYLIPWMWIGYGFVYYDKVQYIEKSKGNKYS